MKNQMYFRERSKLLFGLGSEPIHQPTEKISCFSNGFPVDGVPSSSRSARLAAEGQAFAMAVQTAREEEKARLARELHDELAQSLIVLKMDAVWVRDQVSADLVQVTAKLDDMVEMLDRTIAATRRMAADLRPLMLDDLGAVPAIEWLASSFMKRYRVPCNVKINAEFELFEPHATALFRIVQESLNNIAKHASASQVVISMNKNTNAINIMVKDDGCGFYIAGVRNPQSLGIVGMQERAQLLGGHVVVSSMFGMGTCVEVNLPLGQIGTH